MVRLVLFIFVNICVNRTVLSFGYAIAGSILTEAIGEPRSGGCVAYEVACCLHLAVTFAAQKNLQVVRVLVFGIARYL